jgi:DnaJ-class molecular chaperone
MILNRCDSCCGKKTIVAPGNFVKECPKCAGIGYVKIDTKVADDVKVKRKKGE